MGDRMKLLPVIAFIPDVIRRADQAYEPNSSNMVKILENNHLRPRYPANHLTPIRVSSSERVAIPSAKSCCALIETGDQHYDDMKSLRLAYEKLVRSLVSFGECLAENGLSNKTIAKILFEKRRQIALSFKKKMPPGGLKEVLDRNREKYGDRLGLTWEQALKKYNDDFDLIIKKACETNGSDLRHLLETVIQ